MISDASLGVVEFTNGGAVTTLLLEGADGVGVDATSPIVPDATELDADVGGDDMGADVTGVTVELTGTITTLDGA